MNQIRTDDHDHALIEQFKRGSARAMEQLIEKYEGSLFNFGLRMCGHTQDAEDIMQETFLNAFKSLKDFREETKLRNWLFRIAANACYRQRRKKKFEPDNELSLESLTDSKGSGQTFDIPDWTNDPAKNLLRSELKEVILAAVQKLPPIYRMVFNLRDMEGFNTEETADIMGVTTQSVKTRLHRARLFLRNEITEHYKGGKSDA